MLVETAVTHARANGLNVVELTTSELNKAGLVMYGKDGWTVKKRMRDRTLCLLVLRKRL
jgi:hypothetical protein